MSIVKAIEADITKLDVDVIVNAANNRMLGGGGVDGAIHRAAGIELYNACLAIPEVRPDVRCPTGRVRITPGFNLKSKFVIHTVGPIWEGGSKYERELLAECYRNSLMVAVAYGCESIAFPAISTGVYGFPVEAACEIAIRECEYFVAEYIETHNGTCNLSEILLVTFMADKVTECFRKMGYLE